MASMPPEARAASPTALSRALLVVLCLLGFGPGARGEFLWDDHVLIEHNSNILRWSTLPAALARGFWNTSTSDDAGIIRHDRYWRPWVTLAYALQAKLLGLRPLGFHLVSLALHVACVLLAFEWLRARTRTASQPSPWPALVAAALFAVHPSRAYSVTWISGSCDLWMALFFLCAAHAWRLPHRARSALLVGLCALGAILSKEHAVVLPALLWADARLSRPDAHTPRHDLTLALCALASVLAALGLRAALLHPSPVAGMTSDTPRVVLGTLGLHLREALWPVAPSIMRGDLPMRGGVAVFPSWSIVAGALSLALSLVVGVVAWRKASARGWAADLAWWWLLLLPVSNLIPLDKSLLSGPWYLYLPLLGLLSLLARALVVMLDRAPAARSIALALCVGLVASCAGLSIVAGSTLRSDLSLWGWEHDLAPDRLMPIKMLVENNSEHWTERDLRLSHRGFLLATQQQREPDRLAFAQEFARVSMSLASDADTDALGQIRRFLDDLTRPDATASLTSHGLTLSLALRPEWQRMLADDLIYRVDLALAHARAGDAAGAEEILIRVGRTTSHSKRVWVNLALIRAQQDQWADALAAAQNAQRLDPESPESARLVEAIEQGQRAAHEAEPLPPRERALRMTPAYISVRGFARARAALDAQLALSPADPELVVARARVDFAESRIDLALAVIDRARAIDPAHEAGWQILRARLLADAQRSQRP